MKIPDNKGSFEQQWQNAFADAEMAPDANVWKGIELGLAKETNSNYKKRLLFFKLLAAASVSLAGMIGAAYMVNRLSSNKDNNQHAISENIPQSLTQKSQVNKDQKEAGVEITDTKIKSQNQKEVSALIQNTDRENRAGDLAINDNMTSRFKANDNTESVVLSSDKPTDIKSVKRIEEHGFNDVKSGPDHLTGKGYIALTSAEPMDRKMSFVPRLEYLYSRKNKSGNSWVGVSLAMGSNSPNSSSEFSASALEADNFSSVSDAQNARVSEEQGGNVYGAGLSLGKQLSKRWVIEGGLNYMQRSTFVESNLAFSNFGQAGRVFAAADVSESSDFALTQNYEIKNTYNTISLPIQAGYVLVDGRLDLLLKVGVSNEILLWNRVEDTSNQLQTVTLKPGDDSQYNTYIFSGLVGTELRYLLGERYYISVTPQAQKSINSITNSDAGEDSRPLIFLMGFRFKYLLR